MANEFLDTALVRHQIWLQGLATHEANTFNPYLNKADKIIRSVLSSYGDRIDTVKTLNEIIRQLKADLGANYSNWGEQLITDLEEIAESEAQFTRNTLDKAVVGRDVATPAPTQLWAAINVQPIQLNDKGESKLMQSLIKGFSSNEVNRVNGVLRNGFYSGATIQDMITAIRGTKKNQYKDGVLITSKRSAESIARTSTNHVSNVARQSTYKANQDILKGWEFNATLDNRTTNICRFHDQEAAEGKVYPMGKGPLPPLHLNCVTGDANVSSSGLINTAYRRRYKGAAVNITTKSGRSLCITPNHPVLTSTGWKAAKLLDTGDKLVCTDGVVHGDNKNGMKTPISNIFGSLNVATDSLAITDRPASSKDFHGDISDSKVRVIDVNSLRRNGFKVPDHVENYRLDTRPRVNSSFSGFSAFNSFFNRTLSSLCSLISGRSKSFGFFRGGVIHSCLLLLTSVSRLYTDAFKGIPNCSNTNSKPFFYTSDSNAGIKKRDSLINKVNRNLKLDFRSGNSIELKNSFDWFATHADDLGNLCDIGFIDSSHFDDIVDLTLSEIDTHVYNLETGNNWYSANGIVTHNCRSSSVPVIKDKFDIFGDSGTRASKGAKGGQQTNAKGYYGWLERQPKWFQQDVLGKAQTELFRKGNLTNEQFRKLTSNKFGEPLTLDQIKAKDPDAWRDAGLD